MLQKKSLLLTVLIAMVVTGLLVKNPPKNILSWDTYGHYLYLPATFIYDDPFLSDISIYEELNDKYHNLSTFYVAYDAENGNRYIKYPVGFSVLMSPFFALGHLYCKLSDYPPDGFSKPYQVSVIIGCWFYFIVGLFFLERFLSRLFKPKIVIALLLVLTLGTNFVFYETYGIGQIHGVAFAFYAMLLYFTYKWYDNQKVIYGIGLGVSFGLLSLSRASEVVAIIIPLFWGVKSLSKNVLSERWLFFKTHKRQVILIGSIIFFIGTIQLIYWKLCTGSWIIDSYNNPGEGFDFFPPHLIDFLLSYRKGWLLYTPIMIFALTGMYTVFRYKKEYRVLVIFGLINVLLLSAWTCWWYAASFGQRSMIQSYPVYLTLIGFFFTHIARKKWEKYLVSASVILMIGLNQFQTWQFTTGIIDSSRMTKDAYWAVFLSLERPENMEDLLLVDDNLNPEECIADENRFTKFHSINIDFEKDLEPDFEVEEDGDNHYIKVTTDNIYSDAIDIPFRDLSNEQYTIVELKARFLITGDPNVVKPAVAFKIFHGDMYFQKYLTPHIYTDSLYEGWKTYSMSFFAPYVRSFDDNVQVFGWLMGEGEAYIDDIEITSYLKK